MDEQQQHAAALAAFENDSLSFGFSAGGLLFPYYVGASKFLMASRIMTERTRVAGASAGSLIAACARCLTIDAVAAATLELAADW